MPKQKESGKSVILNLSVKVVKTKDIRKMLPTAQKDQNIEMDGLPGITWNNSMTYSLLDVSSMLKKIINMSEIAVAGRLDLLVLKIQQAMEESEILEDEFVTEKAVMEKCWDNDCDVIVIMKDGEKGAMRIGMSRKNGKEVVIKGTGGLPLPYGKIKSIQFLS